MVQRYKTFEPHEKHFTKQISLDTAGVQLCVPAWAEWQAVEPRVKRTFLPIFWVEEKSQATAAQCNDFKKQVIRVL